MVKPSGPALYLAATRPQFFTAILLPALLGAAMGWSDSGELYVGRLLLTLLAAVAAHAGINLLNDYYDHLSGADEANAQPLTPFAGGSRFIQNGWLSPRQVRAMGWGWLGLSLVCGLWLSWLAGPWLLLIGLIGLLSGVVYSMPPLALNYRGWGELLVGLNFGVLAVCGAYYVQTGTLGWLVFWASLPLAFLVAAILYINQFPDHDADRIAGKQTLVVRWGPALAGRRYWLFPLAAAVSLLWGVAQGLPSLYLLGLLPLALAWRTQGLLNNPPASVDGLVPGIQAVIGQHGLLGLVLIGAQLLQR